MTQKFFVLTIFLLCPAIASAATLSLSPSSRTVKVGDTFSVTVTLDTQGSPIDGVDMRYINFPSALLQVVDSDSAVSGDQIRPGSLMPLTLSNTVDNSLGHISFSQVVAGGTKYTGSGTLATITFKARASGVANVTFDYTPGNTTDSNIAAGGTDILNAVINGSYAIQSASGYVNIDPTPALPAPGVPSVPGYIQSGVDKMRAEQQRILGQSPYRLVTDIDVEDGAIQTDSTSTPASISFGARIRGLLNYIFERILNGALKLFGRW